MTEDTSKPVAAPPAKSRDDALREIDSIAWALLFIWAGTTILMHGGLGWFLVGLGGIMAGAELARYAQGLKVDGFWLACGLAALIAGVFELAGLSWRAVPLLLIMLGAGILINVLIARVS